MNFLKLLKTALSETHRDLIPVWKRGWATFLTFAIVLEFCHYLLLAWGEFLSAEWGPPMADFMAGLLASGTYILVIPVFARDVRHGTPVTKFLVHMRTHFNQVMIEMVRVMAKVIIGILLFLIPGIVWSIQLSFVPLIAQFNEDYLAGKVDALRQSESLVKGRFWGIAGISLIFFLISILESIKYVFPPESPFYALMVLVNLFLEVYVYILFFSVYERLSSNRES